MSSFIANYNRKLRIGVDIKRKLKVEKAMEFAERIKVQKEVGAVLRKVQEEMKQQADRMLGVVHTGGGSPQDGLVE